MIECIGVVPIRFGQMVQILFYGDRTVCHLLLEGNESFQEEEESKLERNLWRYDDEHQKGGSPMSEIRSLNTPRPGTWLVI